MDIASHLPGQIRRGVKTLSDRVPTGVHHSPAMLYVQLSDLTMVPMRVFTGNVLLARRSQVPEGDLVECGTWRGGMSAAMAWAVPGRHSVLFDSFEGLPPPKPADGKYAEYWSREIRSNDNCSAGESWAIEAMARVHQTDVEIIKGWFEDTVPAWAKKQRQISVLRLDGDWYESTMLCLEHLWPLVTTGGLVIIDDYYTWEGCSRAVHDYLSRHQLPERIEQSEHGVAYMVRR